MSRFLPTKSGNPGELAILTQKIKYYEYTKCSEIPNNALDNINSNGLILLRDSSIGLEEMRDKSNKSSNSFAILDLGI